MCVLEPDLNDQYRRRSLSDKYNSHIMILFNSVRKGKSNYVKNADFPKDYFSISVEWSKELRSKYCFAIATTRHRLQIDGVVI